MKKTLTIAIISLSCMTIQRATAGCGELAVGPGPWVECDANGQVQRCRACPRCTESSFSDWCNLNAAHSVDNMDYQVVDPLGGYKWVVGSTCPGADSGSC
jgi:hypothetical protein